MENLESTAIEGAGTAWYEAVTYEDAKVFIKSNIESAARSFLAIGYYLKTVRDKEMYLEDGHGSVWDFAQAEYGISKSTASRYMTMNDRFSKDGNSPVVADAYKGFGKGQLQEMLYLTEEQIEQVTPDMTVSKLREMKGTPAREIPYIPIPGQLDIHDFPGISPEDVPPEWAEPSCKPEKKEYTIQVEELVGTVAVSQQPEEPGKTGCCIHRPEYLCTLEEAQKMTTGDGDHCSQSCCWNCARRGQCGYECNSSARRPMEDAAEAQQEPVAEASRDDVPESRDIGPEKVVDGEFREIGQPELPPLKNNDQRAAFVDAYEAWPLWIETVQTGERYYRYDLEDGTSMVVKVYHMLVWDWESSYIEGYGRKEYYLLQPGSFFKDCEVNRSALIEKLKDIQRVKKGE